MIHILFNRTVYQSEAAVQAAPYAFHVGHERASDMYNKGCLSPHYDIICCHAPAPKNKTVTMTEFYKKNAVFFLLVNNNNKSCRVKNCFDKLLLNGMSPG